MVIFHLPADALRSLSEHDVDESDELAHAIEEQTIRLDELRTLEQEVSILRDRERDLEVECISASTGRDRQNADSRPALSQETLLRLDELLARRRAIEQSNVGSTGHRLSQPRTPACSTERTAGLARRAQEQIVQQGAASVHVRSSS